MSWALRGAFTALVTPFSDDGSKVDWPAFERLVESQIADGISGLVPCGTTGESPTLTDAEHIEVIRRTVQLSRGRVPVLAGTGSNSTREAIALSRAAAEAGADGVMIVMPYYNKPTQAGLVHHVGLVAASVDVPVVLYNIPARCSIDLLNESVLRILDACANVVGVKDATGNVMRCQDLVRSVGDRVTVMCGDDGLTVGMMACGAKGVISVTSNVYPGEVAAVARAMSEGRWADALRQHLALLPVHTAMFVESNPAPAKAALAAKGRMTAAVRPPLVEASAGGRDTLRAVLDAFEAR